MPLDPPPQPTEPIARTAVRELFQAVHEELERRAAIHKLGFAKVWRSGTHTPQQFFDEAGQEGELFLQVASANVLHIKTTAEMIGKALGDYLQPADYIRPQDYTASNGVVTLVPIT